MAKVNKDVISVTDFDVEDIPPALFDVIPLTLAQRLNAAPYQVGDSNTDVVFLVEDINDIISIDDLRRACELKGFSLQTLQGAKEAIITIHEKWKALESIKEEDSALGRLASEYGVDENDLTSLDADSTQQPTGKITKLVVNLLDRAIVSRATDIHLEPTKFGQLKVRIRVDGVLHSFGAPYPKALTNTITSRIKLLSEIRIENSLTPQSGRFTHRHPDTGKDIDFRVETLPTHTGLEQIVLRILNSGDKNLTPDELGFDENILDTLRAVFRSPHGLIVITGPTGAGKTSTQSAFISEITGEDKKTLTIEDPVELLIPNAQQHQVNTRATSDNVTFNFSTALKHFLRADPDIILVGEIRDPATANLSLEAAQTGHLVLTTLHTNDAASAPGRLQRQGLEPYLVASTLRAILSQQLLRRLCTQCKVGFTPTKEDLERLKDNGYTGELPKKLYKARPEGCNFCAKHGFRGQIAIGELLLVDEKVAQVIVNNASSYELEAVRKEQGWKSLRESAMDKVLSGVTSIQEVERVLSISTDILIAHNK